MPDATRLYYRNSLPRLSSAPPRYLPPTPTPCAPHLPSSPSPAPVVAAVGALSGGLGAMCGVGGAIFAIPALVRFTALSQREAAANSLVAVTCVAVTGAASIAGASGETIDWHTVTYLSGAAALFTPLGAAVSSAVNAPVLRRALGSFMLILAPIMPLRAYLQKRQSERPVSHRNERPIVLAAAGSAIGLTSGLLGISGGSLFTPIIALLAPDQSFKQVLATSFATMVVPTAFGALSYARMGLVRAALVPPLVLGAVLGAGVGSTAAVVVPDSVLQCTFATVFAVMGMRVIRAPIAVPGNLRAANASRAPRVLHGAASPA
ncbi:unnamed protein product [Agarophyton chilense]